jgi:site-specific recombinase XerD
MVRIERRAAAVSLPVVPVLVAASGTEAAMRFLDFFATQIENDNTRAAYVRAAREFLAWCDGQKIGLLTNKPVHVAAWIKQLKLTRSVPTVKLRLAAIRHLFDWLVMGHVMQTNPALSVRGPKHVVRKGKTPILDAAEVLGKEAHHQAYRIGRRPAPPSARSGLPARPLVQCQLETHRVDPGQHHGLHWIA